MRFFEKYTIFLNFLNYRQKTKFYFLIFILVIQSILEVIGVGIVIPILSILLYPENNIFISIFKDFLSSHFHNQNFLIILIFIIILFFFLFKSFFLYFASVKMYNFSHEIQISIRKKIFSHYILMSYPDYLRSKTTKLIANITTNTNLLTIYFSIPVLIFASEGLILFSILLFLLVIETKGFLLLLFCLAIAYIVCYKFFSKKLKKMGYDKEVLETQLLKIVQHSIGSIKITKLHHLEEKYSNDFENTNQPLGHIQAKSYILQNIQKVILEFIGFLVICIIIFFLILTESSNLKIITTVGLFAAAGFKIIPSVNRLIFSIQAMKYSTSVLLTMNNILLDFNRIKKKNVEKNIFNNERIDFSKSIEFKNIFFQYPGSKNLILNNFNFHIRKSKKIGIVGASGSGKTTFLDILIGLIEPDKGEIFIDEKKVSLNNKNWRDSIAYVPQNNYIIDDTLVNNVAFGVKEEEIDNHLIDSLLKLTSLEEELVLKNPLGKKMFVGERGVHLSGGQIQRIGIARALYRKPRVLIMDEPTSSLDSNNEKKIIEIIDKIQNLTLIIVSHRKSSLEKCDEIYTFKEGTIKMNL